MSRVPVVAAPAGRQHGPYHLHFGRYHPALSSPSHARAAKDQIVASLYQWGTVMRAVRFETGGVVKIVQIPDPRPGPEEVLVQVHAAGVCRTDLHLLDQVKASERKPLVPGHEIAGRVSKIGADVYATNVGDRVVVHFEQPCGQCRQCHRKRPKARQRIWPRTKAWISSSTSSGRARPATWGGRSSGSEDDSSPWLRARNLCR